MKERNEPAVKSPADLPDFGRRKFIRAGGTIVAAAVVVPATAFLNAIPAAAESDAADVSANEFLMRQHGILDRVLLIYDEIILHLESGQNDISAVTLCRATDIIQRYIQNFHEKLEEEYVFPILSRKGKLLDLVGILKHQHDAGRVHTNRIRRLAVEEVMENPEQKKDILVSLTAFAQMYRPHKSWEDTVLFPMFASVAKPGELAEAAGYFEEKERERFGEEGFQDLLKKVVELEKRLEIHDLAQYTPEI